jgi:hypothetical protein
MLASRRQPNLAAGPAGSGNEAVTSLLRGHRSPRNHSRHP